MKKTVEPKFKIGDVVTLNSNKENPMTIKVLVKELNPATIKNDLFYGTVKCSWFENGVYKEDQFNQNMLSEIEN